LARPIEGDAGLPTPLVVKRLHPGLEDRPEILRRFRDEAELAVAISSPNLARVHDVGMVGDLWYIAMDLVCGWRLAEILDAAISAGRNIPLEVVLELAASCLSGLTALHEAIDARGRAMEIVHRDLSPGNLMIGDDGVLR